MDQHIEEPFFFYNGGIRLFGILHSPSKAKRSNDKIQAGQGIVFCHPFAEEKTISHRVLVNFARFLCDHGYYVLRFDYRGCGDSGGDFEESNLTVYLSDISRAVDEICDRLKIEFVHLFGLRLGATLAALAAKKDIRVRRLVLWEPVVDLRGYFSQFIRMQVVAEHIGGEVSGNSRDQLIRRLEKGKNIEILSYVLSSQSFKEFSKVDLISLAGGIPSSVLIVAIMNRCRQRKDLETLIKEYQRHNISVQSMHIKKSPFWFDPNNVVRELAAWQGHENLFQQTLDWLQK